MALSLSLAVGNPRLSVFEGLQVEVTLTNHDGKDWLLPGPDDESGAFGFFAYDEIGAPAVRMDGLTGQRMTSTSRVDSRPTRDLLPVGGEWKWTVDLATLHYPLPAGTYRIEVELFDPDQGVHVRSAGERVEVEDAEPAGIASSLANPVMDGLALLFRTPADAQQGAMVLRQYNLHRPLAAWYSTRWPAAPAASVAFYAHPAFFQTDSFDPFFRRWVVGKAGEELWAQAFDSGEPEGEMRSARIPEGRALVPTAFQTLDDALFVVLSPSPGALEWWRWEPSGLSKVFEHSLPKPSAPFALGADEESIRLAYADRGLVARDLDWNGHVISETRLHDTRLPAEWIECDSITRSFRALFRDGPHGKTLQMASAGWEGEPTRTETLEGLGLKGDIREIHFGVDPFDRFHALVATDEERLYGWNRKRGLGLLACGQDRYYPMVVASKRVYFGYNQRGTGYRFFEFNRGYGPRILESR